MTVDFNIEIRNRIRVAVAAYAYEFENDSVMSDHDYDKLSLEINPLVTTGNELLDRFFKSEFDASTSQWVHQHPELGKLKWIYHAYHVTQHNDLFGKLMAWEFSP